MTKSPEIYLQEAKEKLRKEFNDLFFHEVLFHSSKEDIDSIFEWFYSKLKLQEEDANKCNYSPTVDQKCNGKQLFEELKKAQAELSQVREEKAKMQSTIDEQKLRMELLENDLREARQEATKV